MKIVDVMISATECDVRAVRVMYFAAFESVCAATSSEPKRRDFTEEFQSAWLASVKNQIAQTADQQAVAYFASHGITA